MYGEHEHDGVCIACSEEEHHFDTVSHRLTEVAPGVELRRTSSYELVVPGLSRPLCFATLSDVADSIS